MEEEKATEDSSNGNEDTSKGADEASTSQPPRSAEGNPIQASSSESPITCSVCLGDLTDKSFTDSCSHSFCYNCIHTWSRTKPACPLCKADFGSIYHNQRTDGKFKRHFLRTRRPSPSNIDGSLQPLDVDLLPRPTAVRGAPQTDIVVLPAPPTLIQAEAAGPIQGQEHLVHESDEARLFKRQKLDHAKTLSAADCGEHEASRVPSSVVPSGRMAHDSAEDQHMLSPGLLTPVSHGVWRAGGSTEIGPALVLQKRLPSRSRDYPPDDYPLATTSTASQQCPSPPDEASAHGLAEFRAPMPLLERAPSAPRDDDGSCSDNGGSPELTDPISSHSGPKSSSESEAAKEIVAIMPAQTSSSPSVNIPLHGFRDFASSSSQGFDSPMSEYELFDSSDRMIVSSNLQQTNEDSPMLTEDPGPEAQINEGESSEDNQPIALRTRKRPLTDTYP